MDRRMAVIDSFGLLEEQTHGQWDILADLTAILARGPIRLLVCGVLQQEVPEGHRHLPCVEHQSSFNR